MAGLGLAARYVTGGGTVGGDWYDVFIRRKFGIAVGDVAGSGLQAAVIMDRIRSALRAYVLGAADPAGVLRLLDRTIQYFEPDAMAIALYGLYTPQTGEPIISSAGHLPSYWPHPVGQRPCFPSSPPPTISTADDPQRQSAPAVIPPGAFLCCCTDGLVERRGHSIDHGIGRLPVTMDKQITARHASTTGPLEEDACAAVMRALGGNDAAPTTSPSSCPADTATTQRLRKRPVHRPSSAASMRRGRGGSRESGLDGRTRNQARQAEAGVTAAAAGGKCEPGTGRRGGSALAAADGAGPQGTGRRRTGAWRSWNGRDQPG